jgi:hypothetical protein
MRFDVRLFVKISDAAIFWFVVAHIGLFCLTAWGLRASSQARAFAARSVLPDIWSTPLLDLLPWAGAIAVFYITVISSIANGIAPSLIVGQWLKTKGWPLPGLWMGLVAAVYTNVWLFYFMRYAVMR